MEKKLNIIFMGTPEFAVASLAKIIENRYNVQAVVTAPDRPAGRGQKLKMSEVKEFALKNGIPVLQPEKLKETQFIETLKQYQPDLFIVVAFRMLPKAVWEIPTFGTFNLHGSLLPQYRGAAPINWAIVNGEKETGVTTFFIDEKIDTGQIILQEKMEIGENETAGELHDRMKIIGADVVVKTIQLIENGNVNLRTQNDIDLKFAPKISKSDCLIDLDKTPEEIHNFIRGMSPYPTAFLNVKEKTKQEGKTIKIFKSVLVDSTPQTRNYLEKSGKSLLLKTKQGVVSLLEVQLEGRKRLSAADFLLGFIPEEWELI